LKNMAGYTVEKLRQIGHDVAHSWYFRFWGVMWIVFAVVVFAGMIILSKSSNTAAKDRDVTMWIENATSITFPRFHIRTDHRGNETITTAECSYEGQFLEPQLCQSWKGMAPSLQTCNAFASDTIVARNDWSRDDSRIYCTIQTTGVGQEGNTMVAFELEGTNVFSSGGNMYASIWLAPNDNAWVMLEKSVLQANKKHPQIELWQRTLLYHSTSSMPNYYNVTAIMGSYFVVHYEPKDVYNGWMAIGDIGGVAFFMVILHTIAMIVLGLFLTNTSQFLSGSDSNAKF
jgi:hypothetical protein